MRRNNPKILPVHIYTILQLFAVAIPFLIVAIFWYNQAGIKTLVKEKLEKTQLTRLEIKVQDIIWIEEGEEILVGNRLFDIKNTEPGNGTTIFWGIYDDEETDLVKNWTKMQGKSQNQSLLEQAGLIFLMLGQSGQTISIHIHSPLIQSVAAFSSPYLPGLANGFTGQPFRPPACVS